MGRASALLNNISVNRAIYDRLKVIKLKASNINSDDKSYLFSLDILEA